MRKNTEIQHIIYFVFIDLLKMKFRNPKITKLSKIKNILYIVISFKAEKKLFDHFLTIKHVEFYPGSCFLSCFSFIFMFIIYVFFFLKINYNALGCSLKRCKSPHRTNNFCFVFVFFLFRKMFDHTTAHNKHCTMTIVEMVQVVAITQFPLFNGCAF